MTQTPPSYYSFHFLGLGQAGTIISAEGKCHQMELLHVFLIAEQTLIVRKTFKPSPPPPPNACYRQFCVRSLFAQRNF